MIKIHDDFYMTNDELLQFIYHDGFLHIEDEQGDHIVMTKEDLKDLEWFIKNVIKK